MNVGAGDDCRVMVADLIVKGLELYRDREMLIFLCQCLEDSE